MRLFCECRMMVCAEAHGYRWTRVNEQGDELIELPTGAKVYPMQETGRQLQEISSGGGTTVNFYLGGVTIREDADINRIAAELVERLERQRMIMV